MVIADNDHLQQNSMFASRHLDDSLLYILFGIHTLQLKSSLA